jgi:superfamily II DNA or RNA helicase
MHLICDHLRGAEPTTVVWLAHGRELLEQAAAEFEKAWGSLGNREISVTRAWGSGVVPIPPANDGLMVMSLEKATAVSKTDSSFLDRLGLVTTLTVFDEAHQAVAPTYRRIADALSLRRDASLLGLTATPGRTWSDIAADEELARFFAKQKVVLEVDGYTNPVTGLIDQGYLAHPTFSTVAAESGMLLSDTDRANLIDAYELPDRIVAAIGESAQWNLQVVRTVVGLAERHRRILLFAASIEHSRVLVALLASLGLDAEQVTGESTPRHRDKVIARFKGSGPRPMVLSNYGVLTTGFDAPAASAAVIARPTLSLVLYSQMVGRVLRGPKAGGTPECEVVTVVDPTLPGFGNVADAFINWEDVWVAS